jgi:outer membrane lipoprotein LolB
MTGVLSAVLSHPIRVAYSAPAASRTGLLVALLATTALLVGCATAPRTATAPALSEQALAERLQARQAWLLQQRQWSFSGRAAVRRVGPARRIALSAPVTRQSWRLSGDLASGAGRLEGLDGGPRESDSAQALLRDATGWEIPVALLGSWVRGAPAASVPVESLAYDAEGRPAVLRQAGWTVRYDAWRPGPAGQPDLPERIDAESGDARVRLAKVQPSIASP